MRRRAGRALYETFGGSGALVPLVDIERPNGLDRGLRQRGHFLNSKRDLYAGIETRRRHGHHEIELTLSIDRVIYDVLKTSSVESVFESALSASPSIGSCLSPNTS